MQLCRLHMRPKLCRMRVAIAASKVLFARILGGSFITIIVRIWCHLI